MSREPFRPKYTGYVSLQFQLILVASPNATQKRQEYKQQTTLIIHCLFSEKSENEKGKFLSHFHFRKSLVNIPI